MGKDNRGKFTLIQGNKGKPELTDSSHNIKKSTSIERGALELCLSDERKDSFTDENGNILKGDIRVTLMNHDPKQGAVYISAGPYDVYVNINRLALDIKFWFAGYSKFQFFNKSEKPESFLHSIWFSNKLVEEANLYSCFPYVMGVLKKGELISSKAYNVLIRKGEQEINNAERRINNSEGLKTKINELLSKYSKK